MIHSYDLLSNDRWRICFNDKGHPLGCFRLNSLFCGGIELSRQLQLIRPKVVYKIPVMRAQRVTRNERRNNELKRKHPKGCPLSLKQILHRSLDNRS